MAKPGPAPKPAELRVLGGEKRPSQINYDAPEFDSNDIAPSQPLETEVYECDFTGLKVESEMTHWKDALRRLSPGRILTNNDVALLTRCVQMEREYQVALVKYKAAGPIAHGAAGQPVVSPAFRILMDIEKASRALWIEFGASPSARTRVKSLKKSEQKRGFKID